MQASLARSGAPRSGCDVPLVDAVQEVLFDLPAELAPLSSLALNSCPALNDALAERLGSLPRLTSLSLAENPQLSQETARAARAPPAHLRRLHHPPTPPQVTSLLQRCAGLTEADFRPHTAPYPLLACLPMSPSSLTPPPSRAVSAATGSKPAALLG